MDRKTALLILFIFLVPVFLVLCSYQLIFNFTSYNPIQEGVIDFLNGQTSNLTGNLTQLEQSHLMDVKIVISQVNFIFYLLLFSCLLILLYSYSNRILLKQLFLYGGITTFSLIFLFFLLIIFNFEGMFSLFHQVFFPQGNWIFPQNSFLIQTFPLSFFVNLTLKIVGITLVLASFLILSAFFLKKREK